METRNNNLSGEEIAIKDSLINLTTRGAFKLFCVALACGVISVWSDVALPWLPAVIVALYGSCLLYAAIVGNVSHSDLTNNSPYFLGFVLFLFSLFVTFTQYGRHPDQMQMGFVIRELGASLLTTVVGLPFRQWLFAYDPAQQDHDAFYRTLEEELRRSAGEFKRSQIELVGLVEQFVEVRKTLFAEEQTASERYVANLQRAVSVFDDSFGKYPSLISTALDGCASLLDKVKTKLDSLSGAILQIDASQLRNAETELHKLKQQTVTLRENLDLLNQSVSGLTSKAELIPAAVSQISKSVSSTAEEGLTDLKAKLDLLRGDIESIDKLVSEFVKLQSHKITGETQTLRIVGS